MRQANLIDHQVFALRQELMQRRIERSNHDRESVHRLKKAREISPLHGKKFLESLAPRLFIASQNHRLHVRDTVFGEEHMLSAAEADAFGAEQTRGLRVAWNIGVGTHAELASEFVGPMHQLAEIR